MQETNQLASPPAGNQRRGSEPGQASKPMQLLLSLLSAVVLGFVLWRGFLYLRDSDDPKWVIAIVAIIWGVGGVAAIFFVANWLIEQLPARMRQAVTPYLFIGPAVALLLGYLAFPAISTLILSLRDRSGNGFVWFDNYVTVFTDRLMLEAFRNNLLWILVGATLSVILGLLVAVLADRSRFENLAKSLVFMPMAISMVGAGIIWNFIYEVRGVDDPQIGLLNAIVVGLGGEPRAWTSLVQPWNNLFLIVIVIWLQSGYAMVLFSAAIKGIPAEIIEAARVDGATEVQVFFRIMLPFIRPTLITVSTTVVIFTLKIFDVVMVMTGGQFGTQVIATQFYRQYFINGNSGLGSAIAIVLLVAVIPVMIYNLRQFREREAF
jgi:alpha-glucoside transport system permease protein